MLHDPVEKLLTGWNVHPWIVSIFSMMIPNVLYFTISMASFVFGVNIVFGFLEKTGFLARAAYQFDGLLSKLGLQTGYQMSRGKTKKFRSEKKCMLTLTLQDAKPA